MLDAAGTRAFHLAHRGPFLRAATHWRADMRKLFIAAVLALSGVAMTLVTVAADSPPGWCC